MQKHVPPVFLVAIIESGNILGLEVGVAGYYIWCYDIFW